MSRSRPPGRPPHPDILTPAEWEVIQRIRHGMSNRGIAQARRTSLDAVKFHVANILGKLALSERRELRFWRGRPIASVAADLATGTGEITMPAPLALRHIGQVSLHVSDIAEAERFYGEVLGLAHLYTFGNLAFFDCDGTRLFLSANEADTHQAGSILYFQVPEIEAAYDALREREVAFEGAPHMIHRFEDGTEEWMAFFKDPSENLLAIIAQVKPA